MKHDKYRNHFSTEDLGDKIQKVFRVVGQKLVYSILLLFYAYKGGDTPGWAKNIIIGTLGYFIAPIDIIPDLSPLIGYTDDIGVLTFALVTIACYINEEVRANAVERLGKIFGKVDEVIIKEVDAVL